MVWRNQFKLFKTMKSISIKETLYKNTPLALLLNSCLNMGFFKAGIFTISVMLKIRVSSSS